MADKVIDYDRGVIINVHSTGMDVFMYVDAPGKFLTAHGKEVPDAVAKEAGYDVEKLAKERLRLDRKATASALIDKELADDKNLEEKDLKEKNGFRLVSLGLGRHNVKDPDGNILNALPLPKESASKLFAAMAGEEDNRKTA